MGTSRGVVVGLLALCGTALARAEGPVVRDQSLLSSFDGGDVSSAVTADDFVLAERSTITRAVVWLGDGTIDDDGVLDAFGGELSWGIYADDAGSPGELLLAGEGVEIELRDTGLQTNFGEDLFRVGFELDRLATLEAGTYWFALHEGAWGEAYDSSLVRWHYATAVAGAAARLSPEETFPTSWEDLAQDHAYLLLGAPAAAQQGTVLAGTGGLSITSYLQAADFALAAPATVSAAEVLIWGNEADEDGVVGTFDGILGWAIYDSVSDKPGNLIASGSDDAPRLVDTGLDSGAGADIVRARIRFGRSLELAAGTYWLALHEGAWAVAGDGTEVYWAQATANTGGPTWADDDEASPGLWDTGPYPDPALALFEEVLFASGLEAGVACAWANGATIACPGTEPGTAPQ